MVFPQVFDKINPIENINMIDDNENDSAFDSANEINNNAINIDIDTNSANMIDNDAINSINMVDDTIEDDTNANNNIVSIKAIDMLINNNRSPTGSSNNTIGKFAPTTTTTDDTKPNETNHLSTTDNDKKGTTDTNNVNQAKILSSSWLEDEVRGIVGETSEMFVPNPSREEVITDAINGLRRFKDNLRWKEYFKLQESKKRRGEKKKRTKRGNETTRISMEEVEEKKWKLNHRRVDTQLRQRQD